MSIFLRMKHWQLFVLLVALPLAVEFVMMVSLILFRNFSVIGMVFPALMIICLGTYFGWMYSLGINLHRRLPASVGMSLTAFRLFFFTPVVYILTICAYVGVAFSIVSPPDRANPFIILLIIPVHLFCMFCIFYCLYFVAKAIKAVELQRPVYAGDYIGEFFLLWFYFVGVWFIQPKINKMFGPVETDQGGPTPLVGE